MPIHSGIPPDVVHALGERKRFSRNQFLLNRTTQTAALADPGWDRRPIAPIPTRLRVKDNLMCVAETARKVLSDCRLALSLLEDERDIARWRIQWVAAVALIRAVGHVLDKVDGQNPKIKKWATSAFDRWKLGEGEDAIFTEFVEQERNTVLKEFQFRADLNEAVQVVVRSETRDGPSAEIFALDENLFRPILYGYKKGEDARDVYADAIAWWGKADSRNRTARIFRGLGKPP